jgi:hypothetical protein
MGQVKGGQIEGSRFINGVLARCVWCACLLQQMHSSGCVLLWTLVLTRLCLPLGLTSLHSGKTHKPACVTRAIALNPAPTCCP